MPNVAQIQVKDITYNIVIPAGLTEEEQAQIRENIGAISSADADVVQDGTYPEMTVGTAEKDGLGNNIANTYIKKSAINFWITFTENDITPAELLGGTWEQFGQGRMLIGASDDYPLGSTGGSADAVVVYHNHTMTLYGTGSNSYIYPTAQTTIGGLITTEGQGVNATGEDGKGKNMCPYLAVNFWRKISD